MAAGLGGCGTGYRMVFLPNDVEADSEIKWISFAGIACLIPIGCLGYSLRFSPKLGPRWFRLGLLAAALPLILAGPLACLEAWGGELKSKMAHFVLSFFGVVAFFRMLELVCGTGPRGFDTSLKNFAVYFVSPAEVIFDDDGCMQASPPGHLGMLILRIAGHMLAGTVILSLGRATAFVPFYEPGTSLTAQPFLGFPRALPAAYLQAAMVYCNLATATLMHQVPLALAGVNTVNPFRSPLLLSTSMRDFWGRRWNLLIHRLMKRTFFEPFARTGGSGKQIGGFLAFLMSALFHEYMWLAVNWSNSMYVFGLPLLYFTAQFSLCALEATMARTPLGAWARRLPTPVQTILTTFSLLPLAPLFLEGISGMAVQCAEQGQTVAMLRSGQPAPQDAAVRPPLDWVFMGIVILFVVSHRAFRFSRRSGNKFSKASAKVVPVVASPRCGA